MINFSKDDVVFFLKGRLIFVAGVAIILVSVSGFFSRDRIAGFFRVKSVEYKTPDVSTPTIVGGELILPKVMLDQFNPGSAKESQLHVLSANLFGVFDGSEQQVVPPKLVGIRIMGEVQNVGKTIVQEFSPVVRFLDVDNKEIAKKVGRVTSGFDFFGVLPNAKTLYDVMVDNPPEADKMEIILNTMSATTSAKFDVLKVINKANDVKTAKNQKQAESEQEGTDSGEASGSGQAAEAEDIEYYTISGTVQNSLSNPVSDISVYVWIKDAEGYVFSFGRQDFKGDLISPKKTVDFKINLFPFKDGQKYDKYEVSAWGRRYTL